MAGNVVAPEYRLQKIGKFQTQARLLFAHSYLGNCVSQLYANLMTVADVMSDGHTAYPFYESIVKPLLGSLDYDEADRARYTDAGALAENLRQASPPLGPQIAIEAVSPDVRQRLGSVGAITQRALCTLQQYGFRWAPMYDLLDGGPYFTLPIARLLQSPGLRVLRVAVCRDLPIDQQFITLATTVRPLESFLCARAQAVVDSEVLWIRSEIGQRLRLESGEPVKVICD